MHSWFLWFPAFLTGKTLQAYLLAESYRKQGYKVYSNMICPDFIKINSLGDIPFNHEPKILLLDEVYYFMDSRNWKDSTSTSIFFNTIGKQNILLLITAISPDMVEKRLREQHNYMYLVKSDKNYIHYKILDIQRNKSKIFKLEKNDQLFKSLKYDTKQVPDLIDVDLKNFSEKVKNYNKENQNENTNKNKNNFNIGGLKL